MEAISSNGKRRLFRMIVPKFPSVNVFSNASRKTTAIGPVVVATAVSRMEGWDAEVIDENNFRFPGPLDEDGCPDHRTLLDLRPVDAVGFYGGLTSTAPRLYKLARIYREAGVFTVGGGQHLSFLPEEALSNDIMAVVHGEGEETIVELLRAWERGEPWDGIKGISFLADGKRQTTEERPLIEEFEKLPVPDFGLIRFAKIKIYPVTRIRGCNMRCEFCSVKGKARCASPERLLSQFAYLAETYGACKFFIVDDQFAQQRDETLRFCRLLEDYQRRMKLRFYIFAQVRLDTGRDPELLNAMRACGIRVLAIGYESVIDEELRAMGKGQRASEMLELTRSIRRYGFAIHGMFIFGYPLRRPLPDPPSISERIRRYKRFLRKARLDSVQVMHTIPLPGTELRKRLEKQGRVFPVEEIGWEYYDGNFQLIEPDPPDTPMQMQVASHSIMIGFYRLASMLSVALRVLLFPFAMLPLVSVRSRFTRWYRSWRRSILGFAGYILIIKWQRRFRKDPFLKKLTRTTSMRSQGTG